MTTTRDARGAADDAHEGLSGAQTSVVRMRGVPRTCRRRERKRESRENAGGAKSDCVTARGGAEPTQSLGTGE